MKHTIMSKDLVIAIYFKNCYAGETTLELVKVIVAGEEIPEEYASYQYELKPMSLIDFEI